MKRLVKTLESKKQRKREYFVLTVITLFFVLVCSLIIKQLRTQKTTDTINSEQNAYILSNEVVFQLESIMRSDNTKQFSDYKMCLFKIQSNLTYFPDSHNVYNVMEMIDLCWQVTFMLGIQHDDFLQKMQDVRQTQDETIEMQDEYDWKIIIYAMYGDIMVSICDVEQTTDKVINLASMLLKYLESTETFIAMIGG